MPLPSFISEPLEALLVAEGFKRIRRRELYTREFPDGVPAIEFMRDKWPTRASEARFTAHLGFNSHRLSAAFGIEPLRYVTPEMHWYRWIGYLSETDYTDELMWEVSEGDPRSVAYVTSRVRDRGIPALVRHASDRALRDEWLESADPSMHRTVQASRLAVLIKAIGPSDKLAELEARVRYLAEQGSSDARAAVRVLDA
jgi:hypothetical protein